MTGCALQPSPIERSDAFLSRGDIHQAFWTIEDARREAPDDPELEKRYWELRVDYLLKRAQMFVFHNEESAAVEELEKALTLDPDNEVAPIWLEKASAKLADRARRRGDHARADGRLDDALAAYHEALGYVDGHPAALEGIQQVDEVWQHRRDDARGHYLHGLRSLSDGEYKRTEYHLDLALDKDPGLQEAKPLRDRARTNQGLDALERAAEMEDVGLLLPAIAELELATELLGEDETIDDRLAQLAKEREAERLAHQGEIALYQGDFVTARKLLEQAFDESTLKREKYGLLLLVVTERDLEHQYLTTKDLELQHRYEEALVAYRAIDEQLPGFLDVKARIADLESAVAIAKTELEAAAKAEAAGDLQTALERLRDALDAYPGSPGLAERIEALRARIDAERSDGSAD